MYLAELVNFGGVIETRGQVYADVVAGSLSKGYSVKLAHKAADYFMTHCKLVDDTIVVKGEKHAASV